MKLIHPKRVLRQLRTWIKNVYWYYIVPDSCYLKHRFKQVFGKKLDLNNPQTFNEKIQWLKLHDRNPLYHQLVDKIAVKEWVAAKIGEEYVVPTLMVWNRVKDVDFSVLPDQFVIKCNHDAASWSICLNKNDFDQDQAIRKLSNAMKQDYYHFLNKQWVYKGIKRRILAEPLLKDNESVPVGLTDYKFFCFDGKADCVMIAIDREKKATKFYFFDREWKLLKYNYRGLAAPEGFSIPKPDKIEEMFTIAERLSEGFCFVRVDLYLSCGRIYFGEMTFNPDGGMDPNLLPEVDLLFGNKMNLGI